MEKMIVSKIRRFNPELTFLSGQCFRWHFDKGVWKGIAEDKYAEIIGDYNDTQIRCIEDDLPFWEEYFDSSYDYEAASLLLEKDNKISEAVRKNKGLILLKQPFFETLISFIISANNNIPRIKMIINNLCVTYGDKIEHGYSFPNAEALAELSERDLLLQNCGYRSKYIIETSKQVINGFSIEEIRNISLEDARNELCGFMGVGKKVADCVLIYSLGRKDAYPVDTWIRKASWDYFGKKMNDDEIRESAAKRFGNDAALAQQYMFISEREGYK